MRLPSPTNYGRMGSVVVLTHVLPVRILRLRSTMLLVAWCPCSAHAQLFLGATAGCKPAQHDAAQVGSYCDLAQLDSASLPQTRLPHVGRSNGICRDGR